MIPTILKQVRLPIILRSIRPIISHKPILRTAIHPYSVSSRLKPSTITSFTEDAFSKTKLVNGDTKLIMGITDKASKKLTQIAQEEGDPESSILIKVESGGCHGFQYDIKLTTLKDELSNNPDYLVFERTGEDEQARIIIDEGSLKILQRSKLDYVKELIGSQFKVIDSPYTSSSCGCGSSFDFDFEKFAKDQETF